MKKIPFHYHLARNRSV